MVENHQLSIITKQPTKTRKTTLQPTHQRIKNAVEPEWNNLTTSSKILIQSIVSEKEECIGCIWDCASCWLACCTWVGNITGFYPLDYQFEQRFHITDKSEQNKNKEIGKLKENSNWLCRQFCKESRRFGLEIKKFEGTNIAVKQVVNKNDLPVAKRSFKPTFVLCTKFCVFGQKMEGQDLFGGFTVKQHKSLTHWELGIYRKVFKNQKNVKYTKNTTISENTELKHEETDTIKEELLYKIRNNLCSAGFTVCGERQVFIYNLNDDIIGTVTKKWDGFLTEFCRMYHVCPTCKCNSRDIEIEFRKGMPEVFDERMAVVNGAILSYYILWERNLFCPGL